MNLAEMSPYVSLRLLDHFVDRILGMGEIEIKEAQAQANIAKATGYVH